MASALQARAAELSGSLRVLEEQYADALYSASTYDTPTTRATLQRVEDNINGVSAGAYRLQHSVAKLLQQQEATITTSQTRSEELGGDITLFDRQLDATNPAQAEALASQMEGELQNATVAFLYNAAAIALVAAMALGLRSRPVS
jgi:hypothetical protein